MLGFTTLLSAASLLAIGANAVINTPGSLTTCEPTLLTWDATTGPYYLTVIPDGTPGTTLATLASGVTSTSYTWNVDLAAGQKVAFGLKDGTGALLYTSGVSITAGPSTSCVKAAGSSGGAVAAGTTAAASTTSAAVAATTKAASAASAASSAAASRAASVTGAASSAAAAASSSARTSGASALSASVALGALGLVSAGFFALA